MLVVNGIANARGTHAFLTQRQLPHMSQIVCEETALGLRLRYRDHQPLDVPLSARDGARLLRVRVWEDDALYAADMGEEAANWLSDVLGVPCLLVSANHGGWTRKLDASYVPWHLRWPFCAAEVGFADGFPFLLISEASLSELNARISASDPSAPAFPMNQFRPNIVISGCKAFDEDRWRRIRIGNVEFYSVKG
ncbi:MAG: hypothetical protein SGPRY_010476, partial [Prymnesium sp.]